MRWVQAVTSIAPNNVVVNSAGYPYCDDDPVDYTDPTGAFLDILGVVVEASNTEIQPQKTGEFLVADVIKRFGRTIKEPGNMVVFKPNS